MQRNRKKIFSFWTTLLGVMLLAACLSLAGSGAALAAPGSDITITGEGVNNPVTITQTELQALGSDIVTYSTINTYPTKKWYIGQGVKLSVLLDQAGGLKEDATLIKFTSTDSFTVILTIEDLLKTERYFFQNFMNVADPDTGIYTKGYLFDENSADGRVAVEPIIAYMSAASYDSTDLSDSDANLLLFGQQAVTEQTNDAFCKYVNRIEVLTASPGQWGAPTASVPIGEVAVGTLVELSNNDMDSSKVYYTTDGSAPTVESEIYNWIAKRWTDRYPDEQLLEINCPIAIMKDTVIKAVSIGHGKLDSDVVTFSYTIPRPQWPADSKLDVVLDVDKATLSWPAAGDDVDYQVYHNNNVVKTLAKEERSYVIENLERGKYHTFKVAVGTLSSDSWSTNTLSRSVYLLDPTVSATIEDTDCYIPVRPDASGQVTTEPLQQINMQANTSLSTTTPVQIEIPAGTSITGPANWSGLIQAPAAASATIESSIGTVNAAVEVGYSGGTLNFDKAVKLVIPGQAGKKAGYIDNGGTWHAISTAVTSTDSATVTTELAGKGVREGYQDAGGNLVIWTRHFTKFVTYTPATSGGGPGGGGGGGGTDQWVTSTTGKATLRPGAGGSVSLGSEATIEVPAKALNGSNSLEVRVEKVSSPPAVPDSLRLLSNVYEFSVGGKKGYEFAKNVTISISFDSGALGAGETAAVYYYDETDKQWVKLSSGSVSGDTAGTMVDHFTKFAVLAAASEETNNTELSTGTPAPAENKEALADIAGHWAQANISKLVRQGGVSGYPDGTFQPDNTITRAEFAAILVKAFHLTGQEGKVFADTAGHWAKDYIAAAADNGIVGGYDADTFGPDDLITREQMAVMIVKAAKLTPAAGQESSFADNGAISAWAADAVAAAVQNSLMNGYPDGSFQPQGQATRAEAVTVVVNAL